MSDAMELALSMSPEDRAELEAIAIGFGNKLLAGHVDEALAFDERNPGCIGISFGYVSPITQKRSRSKRFISLKVTEFGALVALLNRIHGLPIKEGAADE